MRLLNRFVDYRRSDSLALKLRRRRFALLERLVAGLPRPTRVLDVGGTEAFWETMGVAGRDDVEIVLLNLAQAETTHANLSSLAGDARDLSRFGNREFDVVFSNSVIEHVGTYADQARMAREVQRVGKAYFVQTPNRYFPVEPHFQCPLFQFLPTPWQVFLLQHIRLGTYEKIRERQRALDAVGEIRLLTRGELSELFPGAEIWRERLLGLTKSFVAYGGFEPAREEIGHVAEEPVDAVGCLAAGAE